MSSIAPLWRFPDFSFPSQVFVGSQTGPCRRRIVTVSNAHQILFSLAGQKNLPLFRPVGHSLAKCPAPKEESSTLVKESAGSNTALDGLELL